MKKKFSRKLTLNKQTVSHLTDNELSKVKGAAILTNDCATANTKCETCTPECDLSSIIIVLTCPTG